MWWSVSPVSVFDDLGLCRSDRDWQTVVPPSQMEYERQVASLKAASAAENDFSVSQAEMSSRQAMLENASDIKVRMAFSSCQGSASSLTCVALAARGVGYG